MLPMKAKLPSFSKLLPIAAPLVSIGMPLFNAISFYIRLKLAAHGQPNVTFGTGQFRFSIPSDHLFSFVVSSIPLLAEPSITITNAPGCLIYLLISAVIENFLHLTLPSASMSTWVLSIMVVCGIPAWWFAGQGLDSLLGRNQTGKASMIISALLTLIFLALAIALRLGMSSEERNGRVDWFIHGFGLWAALIALPFAAWVHIKAARRASLHC